MQWHQLTEYFIEETTDGSLIFEIPCFSGNPKDSIVLYDGGEHALLIRDENTGVILDFINPAVHKKLYQASSVMILEINTENDQMNDYQVPVHPVEKLELPALS